MGRAGQGPVLVPMEIAATTCVDDILIVLYPVLLCFVPQVALEHNIAVKSFLALNIIDIPLSMNQCPEAAPHPSPDQLRLTHDPASASTTASCPKIAKAVHSEQLVSHMKPKVTMMQIH